MQETGFEIVAAPKPVKPQRPYRLANLESQGWQKTDHRFAGLEVWGSNNWRIMYDRSMDRCIADVY